jgi:lysophospholipase L1-like esterase
MSSVASTGAIRGGPRLGWPGTQIRARFSGPGISIVLKDTGTSDYDVAIDGGPPVLEVVSGDTHTYELAAGLAPGEHDLVLTKRTETATGVTQVLGFSGAVVPTPAPSGRGIEMIGDSMTCGYGVLGASQACAFSPDTEDEEMAWGALAAKELGALHSVTAVSGMGLLRNFGGETTETMPARYDRALADDPSSTWDAHAFEPDVIVIDLGTNDFNDGKGDPGPAFQATYTTFLATLRARHAQAHIVAATSPMLVGDDRTTLRTYVQAAVSARQSAGDAKVSWLDMDQQVATDGYGCAFHPSATTQKKMATALVAHLKSHLGW